jgi:hypothetical protein
MADANQPGPPLLATPAASQRSTGKSHLHRNLNPAFFPEKLASAPAHVSSSCPTTIAPPELALEPSPRPVSPFPTLVHLPLVISCPVAHHLLSQSQSLPPSPSATTEHFLQEIQTDVAASLTSPQVKKARRNTSHLPPVIYHIAANASPTQASNPHKLAEPASKPSHPSLTDSQTYSPAISPDPLHLPTVSELCAHSPTQKYPNQEPCC